LILDKAEYNIEYRNLEFDSQVKQSDPFTIDAFETLQDLIKLIDSKDSWIEKESAWISSQKIDLVYLDAPFLPAVAAKVANVKSVVVSNFSFDAIFETLRQSLKLNESESRYEDYIEKAVEMYKYSQTLVRLPYISCR
jgi:vacuolar-type H+-ATPase subunit D/Vma8